MADGGSKTARYVPDFPLPPYSYVTGRFPHPTRDEAGHSFGHTFKVSVAPSEDTWPRCREYLLGIDLFNFGYYWEAHEVWEAVWNACGRRGKTADFVKGLIKLAAAGVKAREGRAAGVRTHADRAAALFEKILAASDAQPTFFGLGLATLGDEARRLATDADLLVERAAPRSAPNEPVIPILELVLAPDFNR